MKIHSLALLLLLLTPVCGIAQDASSSGQVHFGLSGGWDSRLGDQWGIAAVSEKSILSFSIGGFVTSAVEDDAVESVFGAFGDSDAFDSSVTTWSASFAWIFTGSLSEGGFYGGVGYSSANVEANIRTEVLEVDGTFEDAAIDGFMGLILPIGEQLSFDLRVGYGYALESSYEIKSVATNGNQTVTQTFTEADFGDIEYTFLDEFYSSVVVIYRF